MELKELKDWLFLAVQLIIILMLLVAIGNQIVMEKNVDEKIQQVTDRVNETGCYLEHCMMISTGSQTQTLDNIAKGIGVASMCDFNSLYALDAVIEPNYDFWGVKHPNA